MIDLNQVYESVLESDRAAIVICDPRHVIIYMNPAAISRYEKWGGRALLGKSLLDCHNEKSRDMIIKVVDWFKTSKDNNLVYTSYNPKENKDVYMIALRNDSGELIAYYEKHEYRNRETMKMYDMGHKNNPWEDINLEDYEAHMSLDSVQQLQMMNALMKEQFEAYPVKTAMVLGIAGGNGLEHVRADKYKMVYGIDINEDYLQAVSERYQSLGDVLKCLRIDLINEADKLPKAELVIANLLTEYIGYPAFQDVIKAVDPAYVSCVIQINTDEEKWVSDSPYLHAFDRLDEIHTQMVEKELEESMKEIGYQRILLHACPLPNGKALVRMDFKLGNKYVSNMRQD